MRGSQRVWGLIRGPDRYVTFSAIYQDQDIRNFRIFSLFFDLTFFSLDQIQLENMNVS